MNTDRPQVVVTLRCDFERHHWVHPSLLMWTLALMAEKHYKIFVEVVFGAGGHASSANIGAFTFMDQHPDAEWYCQVDNDTVPPRDVMRMLEAMPDDADIVSPVVHMLSGHEVYPMQGHSLNIGFVPIAQGHGVCRVDRAGGGCMFVRRRVFEAMQRPYFKVLYDSETQVMTTSDDVYFQDRAQELGFHMYCDTRYVAEHHHTSNLADRCR